MGLRCIIGHDYGEPERTETREERGDERVVTVREYRECTRCGHRQVISENTEVRSTDEPTSAEPEGREGTGEAEAGTTEPEYEEVTAEEDDGVILEDDDAEPERDPGEWPESEREAEEPGEHDDWPTPEGEDEGFDAEPSSGGPDEGVDFGGGLTPDRSDEPTEEEGETVETGADEGPGTTDADGTRDAATGIRRSDPGPSPTTQQRPAEPDTVFACPNCDHTAPAHESSLRPGDICPECGRGYLTERENA